MRNWRCRWTGPPYDFNEERNDFHQIINATLDYVQPQIINWKIAYNGRWCKSVTSAASTHLLLDGEAVRDMCFYMSRAPKNDSKRLASCFNSAVLGLSSVPRGSLRCVEAPL